jgi:uncharacterized protein with ATP-grasp and redox domains
MTPENSANKSLQQSQLVPAPIMMNEANPFAHFTLTQRMPDIIRRVIAENEFSSEIVNNLEALIQELTQKIEHFIQDEGQDIVDWERYLQPFIGKYWIDIPWFFAEAYFYRRILEATDYFISGIDPYALQKHRGLEIAMPAILEISARVNQWDNFQQNKNCTHLIALLYFALWGNRADMSLFPINDGDANYQQKIHLEQSQILVDHTARLAEKIVKFNTERIDFITDNAGFELFGDLCLADFLLVNNFAETIHLHLKPEPTFVSDATIQDVLDTLDFLTTQENQEVQVLAKRIQGYINQDRLLCYDDYFWASPLVFWEMPEALRSELKKSSLILIKGDANYRRCLGDRQWSFTTAFADIVSYFPAPLAVLRTLKSEIVVGLELTQVEKLNHEDPNWLTNGQWGVIQYVE